MKRLSQLLVVMLAGAAVTVTACDPPQEESEEQSEETAEEQQEEQAEEQQEEQQEEEQEEQEEEAEVLDEEMFALALFETTCVDDQIEDEDAAAEIKEEIYARYGLTEETFAENSDHYDGNEDVAGEVETRMEDCDEDMANSFAEEGAGDVEADDGDEEDEEAAEGDDGEETAESAPEPRPEPAMTGTLRGDVTGSNFEGAELEITIGRDFKVSGDFAGTREGRDFRVNFTGEVSESGALTASGNRRGNTIEIDGRLSDSGSEGTLTGQVHQTDYRVRYRLSN